MKFFSDRFQLQLQVRTDLIGGFLKMTKQLFLLLAITWQCLLICVAFNFYFIKSGLLSNHLLLSVSFFIFRMCCILTYFPNKINASISLEVTKWKICCNNWTWKSADWLIDWQKVVFFSFVLSVSQISSFLATFYYVRSAICQVKYLLSVQKDLREKNNRLK